MVITSDRVDALQDAQSDGFEQPLSVWMYSLEFQAASCKRQAASGKKEPIGFYLQLEA